MSLKVVPDKIAALDQAWLCEALRLQEERHGPLDDEAIVRRLQHDSAPPKQRIWQRAFQLAERDHLLRAWQQWQQASRASRFIFMALMLVMGVLLGKTALAGQSPINIFWALGSLLVLNLISLVVWIISLFGAHSAGPLGSLFMWLNRKLSRDARGFQLGPAWLELLSRQRLLAIWLGRGLHLGWLLASLTAALTLAILLSTQRYEFTWSTTLLSADAFVQLTQALSVIPHSLGVITPDIQIIAQSGQINTPYNALQHQQWAQWLIGMVLVYGALPRLLLALLCQWIWVRHQPALQPDWQLPYYQQLLSRLTPSSLSLGVVDSAPDVLPSYPATTSSQPNHNGTWIAGWELAADVSWPPAGNAEMHDAGKIDQRAQRRALLDQLAQARPAQLIVVCDPRRSVDRGTLHWLSEAAHLTAQLHVWLYTVPDTDVHPERLADWRQQLNQSQISYSDTQPVAMTGAHS